MISKFSVLYVGQIEVDNVGRHGTPADARRYPNERLVEAYHTARDIAQHMDELGYYSSLVIEGIRDFERRYPGLDQVMIHWAEGMGPKEFREQLTRFAREVMPAFPGCR